jgi:hypothetical protein
MNSSIPSGPIARPLLKNYSVESSGVIVLLLYLEGISSLMILDLEAKKSVNSNKRLGIVSGYSQLRTVFGIFGLICDFDFQPFHVLYAWWHRGMDEHRNGKIALRKHYCDHRQMLTDSLLTSCIRRLVALYLDSTTVRQKMEMMSRFLMTETHSLITSLVHSGRALGLGGSRGRIGRLSEDAQGKPRAGDRAAERLVHDDGCWVVTEQKTGLRSPVFSYRKISQSKE